MPPRPLVWLVIGLLVGSAVTASVTFAVYDAQLRDVAQRIGALNASVGELREAVEQLQLLPEPESDALQEALQQMQAQLAALERQLAALEARLPNQTTLPPPPPPQNESLLVEPVLAGLDWPVSLAFAPDGRLFFNERTTGRIRVVENGQLLEAPFADLDVVVIGETGLLGLALHPAFPAEPFVYAYQTYRTATGEALNRVVRLEEQDGQGINPQAIVDPIPAAGIHNGGILAFGPDGKLYISTGDVGQRELAQDLSSLAGKILRVNPDGSIPADNPFPGSPIFSYGHRNVFGLAFDPDTGFLFETENGPSSNDEVNWIRAGGNFGWPVALGVANDPRFLDPLLTFTPNIAPTGAAFATATLLPTRYEGDLFFGDFNQGNLHRVQLQAPTRTRVAVHEIVWDFAEGVLDVERGPDGSLYVSTTGTIYRLSATP
jgi:glucose/arabinose dehydrogenase